MSDRTVHGLTADGGEIVRYDRAGKWYVEWPDASLKPCRPISVREAVDLAGEDGAGAFIGRPGGGRFDSLYRRST